MLLIVLSAKLVVSKDCLLKDQCSCQFDDGSGTVDITSLGNTDQTPKFKDVLVDQDQTYYSYNPCGGFTEGDCSDAAACAISQDKTQSEQIGDASLAKTSFKFDSGNVQVSYTSGSGVISLTEVILQCDQSACEPKFEPQGRVSQGNFLMQLTTICACPNECDKSGAAKCRSGGSSGLGGGSILLIIFFSLLFVYLIVGALIMKFVKKAEGKEVIPNIGFWTAVPSHIKGGIMFTFAKITRRQTPTYDSI